MAKTKKATFPPFEILLTFYSEGDNTIIRYESTDDRAPIVGPEICKAIAKSMGHRKPLAWRGVKGKK